MDLVLDSNKELASEGDSYLADDKVLHMSRSATLDEFTLVGFNGVVDFLRKAIPIAAIYNLSKNRDILDLIIMLERNCDKTLDTFSDVMDMALLGYPNSFCTVHTFGYLKQQIIEGSLFYSASCIEDNLIYRKSELDKLPSLSTEVSIKKVTYLNELFKIEMQKACGFLEGACLYIKTKRFELAMFMLQQSVELSYRCFLNLMRGRDMKCHTLHVLRKNVRRYAPELIGVFSEKEEQELFYLAILEQAYSDARYNRAYVVDESIVNSLRQKIWDLHSRCFDSFAATMINLTKEIKIVER